MCSQRRALRLGWSRAALTVVVALFGASPVRAQTQAEYRAKIRALLPTWHAIERARARADSARMRALPKDTVVAGVVTVLVEPSLKPLVAQAATQADARLRAAFGSTAVRVQSRVFVVAARSQGVDTSRSVTVAQVGTNGRASLDQWAYRTVDGIANTLVSDGAAVVGADLGPDFGRWLGSTFPVDTNPTNTWVGVRVDLVTSSFEVAHACYAGDTSACARALGVAGENDPVTQWLNARERRAMVRRVQYAVRTGGETLYHQCVVSGDDSACTAVLHLMPPRSFGPLLGFDARQSLVRLAMTMGGPDAMARMAAAGTTRQQQLAAAAGIPTDSLIGLWRARVLEARAANPSINVGLALTSLVWAAICGALALGSSRWR
jgi:hypothetical protein